VVAQRVRVQGDQLKLRVWQWGTREPRNWTVETTVDVFGPGQLGIMSWGTTAMNTDLIFWGVGACAPFTGAVNDFAPQYNQAWDWQNFPYELTFPFAQEDAPNLWYPDGWAENRDSGTRAHRAVDIYEVGPDGAFIKGAKIHATHDGVIEDAMGGHPLSSGGTSITPGSGGGYSIHLRHPSGVFKTVYLHMGNDVVGDHVNAFAPHPTEPRTLQPGDTVVAGQHIGYLGDSGSTSSGPHLHVEIRDLVGILSDPQPSNMSDLGNFLGPRWDPFPALKDAEARGDYPTP
jgi:murein DD-endopeptidase MepM/ murein hydrolase activator NlpD